MTPEPESSNPSSAVVAKSLHQRIFDTSPSLREVQERLDEGGVTCVGRAVGASAGLVLSYLTQVTGHSILLVTATPDEAGRARRDWSTFLGEEVLDFPPWESIFVEGSEPDPETYVQRTQVPEAFATGKPVAVVAPVQAILQPLARSSELKDRRILLRSGDHFPTSQLAHALVDAGYRRFPQVARPGDFSIRGGIFDIFPREASHPYRLDFFGDEIDSIRTVSIKNQRSGSEVSLLALTLMRKSDYFLRGFTGKEVTLFDRMPPGAILALADSQAVQERCRALIGQWAPR
ncbi:MAG: hypothetical protein V3T77_07655, partial [Planctomycetota bacterium]